MKRQKGVVFLLTAITESGKTISLVGNWGKHELLKIIENERLLCPACKEHVRLRTGTKRIWHFAHISKLNCDSQIENESEYHLKGKVQLYDWLIQQGIDVEVEKYLPKIKQRPDLFVTWKNENYAIEFQCSTVDSARLLKRTQAYLRANIIPLWILGGKRFKKNFAHHLKITPFDLLMAFSANNKDLRLIYYCPITARFCIASSLTPFSSSTFLTATDYFFPNQLSFSEIITSNENQQILNDNHWLVLKRRWRTSSYLYTDKAYQRIFYENGMPLCLLPGEAGIPVKSMIWIKTAPILWQGWILLMFIMPLQVGEMVSFEDVFYSFKAEVQKGFMKIRQLPSLKNSHYSFALMEYLQQLEKLGVLRKVNRSTFRKVANLAVPKNVEDACNLDSVVLIKLKKYNFSKYYYKM